jgi:hypothetical protein
MHSVSMLTTSYNDFLTICSLQQLTSKLHQTPHRQSEHILRRLQMQPPAKDPQICHVTVQTPICKYLSALNYQDLLLYHRRVPVCILSFTQLSSSCSLATMSVPSRGTSVPPSSTPTSRETSILPIHARILEVPVARVQLALSGGYLVPPETTADARASSTSLRPYNHQMSFPPSSNLQPQAQPPAILLTPPSGKSLPLPPDDSSFAPDNGSYLLAPDSVNKHHPTFTCK